MWQSKNNRIDLIDGFLNGWKYGNCDYGMPGRVTELLKNNNSENTIYSYSVIAIAGIGLIQNANHDFEWVMGSKTMMDYYPRILLSQNEVIIDTNQEILPTLTIISLGGNDYNHQNGNVPSQEEFTQGKIITDLSRKGLKS